MSEEVPRNRHVLIVDDEKNIRFTVAHALKSDNLEVDSAASGVEGLRKVREREYDLLLVDLRMPGMTGLDMLREMRKALPNAPPVVIITAYGVPEQLLEAASLGAIDYVRKPFSIQTIRSVVGEMFERQQSPREPVGTAMYYIGCAKRELMSGRCRQAAEWLLQAVRIEPGNTHAHVLLGICTLLDGGDHHMAAGHFRDALTIDPSDNTASEYLAWISRR